MHQELESLMLKNWQELSLKIPWHQWPGGERAALKSFARSLFLAGWSAGGVGTAAHIEEQAHKLLAAEDADNAAA